MYSSSRYERKRIVLTAAQVALLVRSADALMWNENSTIHIRM